MQKYYETVFMLNPVLSAEQVKDTVQKFKNIITSQGGEITHEEDWGLRQLAYPIKKKSSAFYYLIEFKSEGKLIKTLETEYHRDEQVIRYLTVALDKYALEWANKRKTKPHLIPPPVISYEIKDKEEKQIRERVREAPSKVEKTTNTEAEEKE
ncbi:MAG: 30S ribosomal protein S6 [Cytophagales bacterium]|nr:30S ribosomal protein S6 [Cytophagales bacterium]